MVQLHIRDNRGSNWYFVDNALIKEYGAQLGPYGIAVYNVIAMHANNETQDAYPSYQTIADYLGISRRKVISTVELLQSLNIVSVSERYHEGSKYRKSNVITLLHVDEWGGSDSALATRHSEPDAPYSEPDAPYIVNETHQHSAPGAPELDSLTNPNRTNLKEREVVPKSNDPPVSLSLCPIELYNKAFKPKRPLDADIQAIIKSEVGDSPEKIKAWGKACIKWRLSGHKPDNIIGILDWTKNNGEPTYQQNGGGPPPSTIEIQAVAGARRVDDINAKRAAYKEMLLRQGQELEATYARGG